MMQELVQDLINCRARSFQGIKLSRVVIGFVFIVIN